MTRIGRAMKKQQQSVFKRWLSHVKATPPGMIPVLLNGTVPAWNVAPGPMAAHVRRESAATLVHVHEVCLNHHARLVRGGRSDLSTIERATETR